MSVWSNQALQTVDKVASENHLVPLIFVFYEFFEEKSSYNQAASKGFRPFLARILASFFRFIAA